MLSVFAFAPSVLANDIPLATLSVDNIQVRAEWDVVGDDADHFSVEGGTLMLRPVTWTGYPERRSNTITAIVEVRDKFSTLNPNYEDLITRIKITTVIMGCYAYWTGRFAKSFRQELANPPNQIIMEDGTIKSGDVIARRNNDNGYNNIFLHTVTITEIRIGIDHGIAYKRSFMTTSPDLFEYLNWDSGKAAIYLGWTELEVNESETCFAEEIETFQEQQQMFEEEQQKQQILQEKTEYLNVYAPLISGFYAGKGRTVTVSSAFVHGGNQVFYVNLSLGNILNELYPPKVIIDDGKTFSIDGKYPIDNSYAYFANLAEGSDSVSNYSPHEVIVLNHACPTISEATTKDLLTSSSLLIEPADLSKVKAYVLVDGRPYKVKNTREVRTLGIEIILEDDSIDFTGQFQIKFSDDHFLCEGYQ